MLLYSQLTNMFNGILQKFCALLIVFITVLSLPTFAMDKKTKEIKEKTEINPLPFFNTITTLAGTIEGFQTVLHPSIGAQTSPAKTLPSHSAYQQAMGIMLEQKNPSLFSRAPEIVRTMSSMPGMLPGLPSIKTTDYHTGMESMVLAAMQVSPQNFVGIETRVPVLPENIFDIGIKFIQEFTHSGALDNCLSLLQQKIASEGPSDSNQAMMELANSGANLFRLIGSGTVKDPTKDPFNKYVNPEHITKVIELEKWLKQNPQHEEYNTYYTKFMELSECIREKQHQVMQEGTEYTFPLFKRLKPDFAHIENISEVASHLERQWSIKKREEFEAYVLEQYGKPSLFEPNVLRSFWETLERKQYGKVCYDIVCESFKNQHKNNSLHQIVQQIWFVSQLDTMNKHPKEARSRMPIASVDGISASNFGYAMGRSDAYQKWIANPLARASGDIIMDAYHSVVDFGLTLDIEVFLGRLHKHLYERTNFFSASHKYDHFMRPFERYLLENVFQKSFISGVGRTISGELIKTAGSNENLFAKACVALNGLIKFSKSMFAWRPSEDNLQKGGKSRGSVFGIGFNGLLFDSPCHSQKEDNEICIAFSSSGQKNAGYLLLSLISEIVKSRPSPINLPSSFFDNIGNNFNRYKPLIYHHVLKETANAPYDNPYWDANMRANIEKRQAKFKEFKVQLDSENLYENLTPELQGWIRDTSNWYYIPSEVKIQIPSKMPPEERHVQYAAQNLLFDALTGLPFSKNYSHLTPHLFLHYKEEIMEKTGNQNHTVIKEAKNLDKLPQRLQGEILNILDNLVKQVHPELKSVWHPIMLEKFQRFMNMGRKSATVDAIANLPSQQYENFRRAFFEDCNVSQCVEPVFARVLGHDRFFPVYLSKKPAKAPIRIGNTHLRLQLGNRIPQDVIAPCDNRCQYHALGHLYTGDMLSYQSADRLDRKRSVHGLGNLPDQLMAYSDIQKLQQCFPLAPTNMGEKNEEMDYKTKELKIKEKLLRHSGNQKIRKILAPEIVARLKNGTASNSLLEDTKCQKTLKLLLSNATPLRAQRINRELYEYAESKEVYQKYVNAISTADDINTECVIAALVFLKEKDVPKSEEEVKLEPRKLAEAPEEHHLVEIDNIPALKGGVLEKLQSLNQTSIKGHDHQVLQKKQQELQNLKTTRDRGIGINKIYWLEPETLNKINSLIKIRKGEIKELEL